MNSSLVVRVRNALTAHRSSRSRVCVPPALVNQSSLPERLERRLVLAVVPVGDAALPDLSRTTGNSSDFINLGDAFIENNPYVRFDTSGGTFDVELRADLFSDPSQANNPVVNFLSYVDADAYDNTVIHRAVPGSLIQGGQFDPFFSEVPQLSPVNVTGFTAPNARGALALPKPEGVVNGAASGWFVNLADNVTLDSADGGYTVFGRVVGGDLTAAEAIAAVPTYQFADPFERLPISGPYAFPEVIGIDQLVTVFDVRRLPIYPDASSDIGTDVPVLHFTVTPSIPGIVTADVAGSDLIINYIGPGQTTLTVEARDRYENVVASDQLVITVEDLGQFDSGFAGDGEATVGFDGTESIDMVNDVSTQPDGKIIVVGSELIGGDDDFAIARIDADGTRDETFNGSGLVTRALFYDGLSPNEGATAVEVLSDGKILFCGYSEDGPGPTDRSDVVLGRLNPDGSFDQTFGDPADPSDPGGLKQGIVRTNVDSVLDPSVVTRDRANGMVVQPDGRIVVVGSSNSGPGVGGVPNDDILVARFTPDGTLDAGFGTAGRRLVAFGQRPGENVESRDRANAVTLQPDGKIVVVGSLLKATDGFSAFAVVRLTPDGAPDTTFGVNSDGKAGIDPLPVDTPTLTVTNEAFAVDIQANNGKIVIGGTSGFLRNGGAGGFGSDFGLIRLNPNGTADTSFNGDGRVTSDFGFLESLADLAVLPDGSIIATGKAAVTPDEPREQNQVIVTSYVDTGTVDPNYGNNGFQLLFSGGLETATSARAAAIETPPSAAQTAPANRAGDGFAARLPVSAADAAADLRTLFEQLVRERQGVVDSYTGGGAAVTAGRGRVVQVAVLAGMANEPAVFVEFDEVASEVPATTFELTVVDDVAIEADSLDDRDLRLTRGTRDFGEEGTFRLVSRRTITGFNQDGSRILGNLNGDPQVVVATYEFVPPANSWDPSENGQYDLLVQDGEIRDTSGVFVSGGKFPNQLDVQIPIPENAPTALLQLPAPLAETDKSQLRFTIAYTAASAPAGNGIDPDTVGRDDVTVVSEDDRTTLVVADAIPGDRIGPRLAVTYVLEKPDGSAFDAADNDSKYVITLQPNGVRDNSGQGVLLRAFADRLQTAVPGSAAGAPKQATDTGPTASATAPPVTGSSGATSSVEFTITYQDATEVDGGTLDAGDVRITAPDNATTFPVEFVGREPASGNAGAITARYRFALPTGAFAVANNGTYRIVLQPDAVRDTVGNPAVEGQLGTFSVAVADVPPDGLAVAAINPGKFRGPFTPGDKRAKGVVTVSFTFTGTPPMGGAIANLELFISTDGTIDGADPKISLPAKAIVVRAPKPAKPGKTPKPPKLPKAAKIKVAVPFGVPSGTYRLMARLTGSGVADGGTSIVVGDIVTVL